MLKKMFKHSASQKTTIANSEQKQQEEVNHPGRHETRATTTFASAAHIYAEQQYHGSDSESLPG